MHYSRESHLNVGTGADLTIAELAHLLADVVDWHREFVVDPAMPDGTPRKLLDVTRLAELGWRAQTELRDGVKSTYRWFPEHANEARGMVEAGERHRQSAIRRHPHPFHPEKVGTPHYTTDLARELAGRGYQVMARPPQRVP